MNPMNKIYTAVLSTTGPIISFTQLNYKCLFRRDTVNSQNGKQLMLKVVATEMRALPMCKKWSGGSFTCGSSLTILLNVLQRI